MRPRGQPGVQPDETGRGLVSARRLLRTSGAVVQVLPGAAVGVMEVFGTPDARLVPALCITFELLHAAFGRS
jgi:hypothetical protein